tara:strand:- start:80 stop:664 length:585 start_codon:yes stop_codon:yes gene_type:complete
MIKEIILASKSEVRKKILNENGIKCKVIPSGVDEEQVKISLIQNGADPLAISKNLAELKSIKISQKVENVMVLGADSVINLENKLISKPKSRKEALEILKKLNGKTHSLISSVCISKNGSMIWNYTDSSLLKMKNLSYEEIQSYLKKINDKTLFAYGVYQIESIGVSLFDKIEGDKNSIMGLPIEKIKQYLKNF